MSEIRERDYLFDNLKAVLIMLVVFGHFCFNARQFPVMAGITNMIYSFHMPLFIFISGYFSKSIRSQRKNDVLHLLIPYLVLELIHFAYTRLTGLGEGKLNPVQPTYQNWYLLSLFFWRLLIPYFGQVRKATGLIIMTILALGAGFISEFNTFLAIYRTIFFMSFFVMGYYCDDLKAVMARFNRYRLLMISGFIISMCIIFLISSKNAAWADRLLYGWLPIFGYEHHVSFLFMRAFALISSTCICFCFCFMIPSGKNFLSGFGQNTLYVFLFHMFLVWPLGHLIIPHYSPVITEMVFLALSLVITWFLSLDIVTRILKPVVQPGTLFKPKTPINT